MSLLPLRDMPIRRKLPLIVLASSGIALVLACGALLIYANMASHDLLRRQLNILAEVVGAQSSAAVVFDDAKNSEEILRLLRRERQIVCAAVYGAGDRVLGRYVRDAGGIRPPDSPPAEGTRYLDSHLLVVVPILQADRKVGSLFLRSDMQAAYDHLTRAALAVLFVLAGSTVTALLLSLKLGGAVTVPLANLARTVQEVAARKDYALQATAHGRDEIGQLIEGFNDMLARIRERDEQLRRTNEELQRRIEEVVHAQKRLEDNYAEIATLNRTLEDQKQELGTYHDLVTHDVTNFAGTLMVIVEHLLSLPRDSLDPKQAELLRRANRQIFQLNRLAANAKTLARLRQKGLSLSGNRMTLDGLLQRVVETVRSVHFDRPITAEVSCPKDLAIFEIPFVENVFLNVVDNAIRHAPRETPPVVRVRARGENGHVEVSVSGGIPAPPDMLSKLFERYERGPRSTGAGLGLSVVREIVTRAGGTVDVGTTAEKEGDAFEIRIKLPRA